MRTMLEPGCALAGVANARGSATPATAAGTTARLRDLLEIFMLCASHATDREPVSSQTQANRG
ncbi:hypothetical protein GCM10020367_23600 [Streptomyces sannanensis]|uniref:Uncharacterized protein n=1 Tax=Streptomyces sannanensis TaxID=285536 RepID=A0ABP6S9T1_9ACTN